MCLQPLMASVKSSFLGPPPAPVKSKKPLIVVAGDPILDRYNYHSGYWAQGFPKDYTVQFSKVEERMGGAANVYSNLACLLVDRMDIDICPYYPLDPAKWYTIVREVADGRIVSEKRPECRSPQWFYRDQLPNYGDFRLHDHPCILIVSDYNRGMVNNQFMNDIWHPPDFDIVIVDSRYGTVDRRWVDRGKKSILHITGEAEYQCNRVLDHDYVLQTDGKNPVLVKKTIGHGHEIVAELPVPDTEVVDTTGAGDTFVAAVASYIARQHPQPLTDDMVVDATRFAIEKCQQVITVMGTALPKN